MSNTFVRITEVGPRDGLQNEAVFIPTSLKLDFIRALANSGLHSIEATSFVSEKWVPQMADHQAVLQGLDLQQSVRYPVLVPNLYGLTQAIACGVKDIAVFTSTSNTFSQKNTNSTLAQSLETIQRITTQATQQGIWVRAYISCAFTCPYEGSIAPQQVTAVANELNQHGIDEIALGDTVGSGTPETTNTLLQQLLNDIDCNRIAVHFHDTQGRALANISVALEHGIRSIDSAAGGLGGCPYAPGASGNVATERVIAHLNQLGYQTGVDATKVTQASDLIQHYLRQHRT